MEILHKEEYKRKRYPKLTLQVSQYTVGLQCCQSIEGEERHIKFQNVAESPYT